MSAHARLAPSAAPQWGPGGCPASVRMQAAYPEPDSPKAREGTAAHFYLSESLCHRVVKVGDIAPNGVPVDQEMVDCAYDMIQDIRTSYKSKGGKLALEQRVSAAALIHPDCWGTPDAYLIDFGQRILSVWDYKYGHRYVDAFRNWQLVCYAVAILETELGTDREELRKWRVNVTIFQPRNYHPDGSQRYWEFTGGEALDFAAELEDAARRAVQPDAAYKTGDHCRDCTARHACPALEKVALSLVDMSLEGHTPDAELPAHAIGLELRIIRAAMKRLGDRATGLEAQALGKFQAGVNIPYWRAEYSRGRERWNVELDEVHIMGDLFGVDVRKLNALTPSQAKKAGVPAEIVKAYSEQPRGAMTLVPFDDKDVAKRFGGNS